MGEFLLISVPDIGEAWIGQFESSLHVIEFMATLQGIPGLILVSWPFLDKGKLDAKSKKILRKILDG